MRRLAVILLISAMLIASTSIAKESDLSYIKAEHKLTPEDDAAIRQVIARLNHALDAADYALYASFFAKEGVFASGFGDAVGPKQVEEALAKVADFITNKRHVAANLVISGEGNEAIVTSYLIVFERQSSLAYVGSAMNVDTLQRRDGKWLVVRHESTLDPATAAYIQSLMQAKK
jgi:uncharacterized protein (TIGR02246 family)